MNKIWEAPLLEKNTIFDRINSSIEKFATKYNHRNIPSLKNAKTLMVFSDYSGEEQEANYFVYSFLIIDADQLIGWNEKRKYLRKSLLADNRTVSYKNYRDKASQRYISEYLKLANELPGYLISFSFDKNLTSIFQNDSPIRLDNPDFAKYREWTKGTLEKAFRICHLIGFLVAGFSTERQNLFWITDKDSIAANNDRVRHLTDLFAYVLTSYLNHDLGHIRVGNTSCDDGSKLIEDLCSIADLTAGAYSDQLKMNSRVFGTESPPGFWLHSPEFQKKTADLTWWLTDAKHKLCRMCFKVDKVEGETSTVGFYHFFNQIDDNEA